MYLIVGKYLEILCFLRIYSFSCCIKIFRRYSFLIRINWNSIFSFCEKILEILCFCKELNSGYTYTVFPCITIAWLSRSWRRINLDAVLNIWILVIKVLYYQNKKWKMYAIYHIPICKDKVQVQKVESIYYTYIQEINSVFFSDEL